MPSVIGTDDGSGFGVLGTSTSAIGVEGDSDGGDGVSGRSSAGSGVRGLSKRADGVAGKSDDKAHSGVSGVGHPHGRGVSGLSSAGIAVYGESSKGNGVLGTTKEPFVAAVGGVNLQEGGIGVLGIDDEPSGRGVIGQAVRGIGMFGVSKRGIGVIGTSDDGTAVFGESTNADGVIGISGAAARNGVLGSADDGNGVRGESLSGPGVYASSDGGPGVSAQSDSGPGVTASSAGSHGVVATAQVASMCGVMGSNAAAGGNGVLGIAPRGAGVHAIAQLGGTAVVADAFIGSSAVPGNVGGRAVYAISGAAPAVDAFSFTSAGVAGKSLGASKPGDWEAGAGVLGVSAGGPGVRGLVGIGIAIHGVARHPEAPSTWAGYFDGDVQINGTLRKTSNKFLIDHPLEPTRKYLEHEGVESDERKNLYDGIVSLDAKGAADVRLPRWFEALNSAFRYQLTAIGRAAPGLHVAAELSGGRFRIAGGNPRQRVCWQVTGVRADAWAKAHPMVVEREKPKEERGTYLHPEAHGKPARRGLRWLRMGDLEQGVSEERAAGQGHEEERRPSFESDASPSFAALASNEGEAAGSQPGGRDRSKQIAISQPVFSSSEGFLSIHSWQALQMKAFSLATNLHSSDLSASQKKHL